VLYGERFQACMFKFWTLRCEFLRTCLSLLCTLYVSNCIKEIAVLLADVIGTSTCCPADSVNTDSVSADNVRQCLPEFIAYSLRVKLY